MSDKAIQSEVYMKMIDKKITVSIKEFDTLDKGIQISPRMTFGSIHPPKLEYMSR